MSKANISYWYFTFIVECWECGLQTRYRERRPLPKPEKLEDRVSYARDTMHGYVCTGGGW